MSTAYRTTCTDCGWAAILPTEAEADRVGEQHECPPPLPLGGTCERPMRPSGGRAADFERADALCAQVDPELFFPHPGDRAGANAAKQICGGCDIRQRCLDVALTNREEHGIFGGHTARERANLLRDQNRSAAA